MAAHRNLEALTAELSLRDVGALAQRIRNADRTPGAYNAIAIEVNMDVGVFRAREPTAQHRRLYLTEDRQLGLGFQSAEVGNEVWYVGGAHVPFVFRPVAGVERCLLWWGDECAWVCEWGDTGLGGNRGGNGG
jgi:hypothetical protein